MPFKTTFGQWMDFTPRWARVTFRQMMFHGVHLGHTVANSTPYCGWMVAGLRQGLFLLDLFKFTYQLRNGFFAVEGAVRRRGPVWFVHPQFAAPAFISQTALRCGEYFIHYPWLGGLLTNHRVLRKGLQALSRRNDAGRKARERRLWQANFRHSRWQFSRSTWPRVLFVSSARMGLKPCHEAQCLGLPALAISDTNSSASLVSVALPANDESTMSLWFHTNLLSVFILHRKFALVNRFLWKSRRRHLFRRGLKVTTAALLFASRDLWRRQSFMRLVQPSAPPLRGLAKDHRLHPWSATLNYLLSWKNPWAACHKRTYRWFRRAAAARKRGKMPRYHRWSILKPRIQRGLLAAFGRGRTFQRFMRLRGAYRSRPMWVFYQTFTSFLMAFASRWLVLTGRHFRRLWRRPVVLKYPFRRFAPWRRQDRRPSRFAGQRPSRFAGQRPSRFAGQRPSRFAGQRPSRFAGQRRFAPWRKRRPTKDRTGKNSPFIIRARTRRVQRLRHPWADFHRWHLNAESQLYPDPIFRRRWQPRASLGRMRYPRAAHQLSRYAARQLFAGWFLHRT